jgi:hypothetical protein
MSKPPLVELRSTDSRGGCPHILYSLLSLFIYWRLTTDHWPLFLDFPSSRVR